MREDCRRSATTKAAYACASVHCHPAALARRADDRIHRLLHFEASSEVRSAHRPTGDGEQIVADLDGLEIVEAELMPRRDTERAIGLVLRSGEDGAKTVAAAVRACAIELQLVESFLRKE